MVLLQNDGRCLTTEVAVAEQNDPNFYPTVPEVLFEL